MSTPDATVAVDDAVDGATTPVYTDLAAFALRPEFFLEGFGCVLHVRDGLLFDAGAALREGDGVIVTDDSQIQRVLSEAHALVPTEVPENPVITSHQFSEPRGEHHPQEHNVPAGKRLWGASDFEAVSSPSAPTPTEHQDPDLVQPPSPPAAPAERMDGTGGHAPPPPQDATQGSTKGKDTAGDDTDQQSA